MRAYKQPVLWRCLVGDLLFVLAQVFRQRFGDCVEAMFETPPADLFEELRAESGRMRTRFERVGTAPQKIPVRSCDRTPFRFYRRTRVGAAVDDDGTARELLHDGGTEIEQIGHSVPGYGRGRWIGLAIGAGFGRPT